MKSNTESDEPIILAPYTLKLDPSLTNDLIDVLDDIWTKSKILKLEPSLAHPKTDRALPVMANDLILIAEPICTVSKTLIELPNLAIPYTESPVLSESAPGL
jgi:hypothetical protein